MNPMKSYTSIVVHSTLLLITVICAVSCMNTSAEDALAINEYNAEEKFDDNNAKDAQFLIDAAEINREEISLGQLVQLKATMKDVRELGEMMEEEHTKSMADLTALAKTKNISFQTSPSEKEQKAYKTLNEKSGLAFDKEYCDMMVSGHQKAIDLFKKASITCEDGDIRDWANSMLPALKRHLDH